MNLETIGARSPLVLVVDPTIASRHRMWRALSRAFGVLEAVSADTARTWIKTRPDIDALVVQEELPDQSGVDFVRALASEQHPIVRRAIVQTKVVSRDAGMAGFTMLAPGDLRGVSAKLASWLLVRDVGTAKALMREVDRLGA
jgi:response regulator RpfG family c-di-GMP phosphodiesterase